LDRLARKRERAATATATAAAQKIFLNNSGSVADRTDENSIEHVLFRHMLRPYENLLDSPFLGVLIALAMIATGLTPFVVPI